MWILLVLDCRVCECVHVELILAQPNGLITPQREQVRRRIICFNTNSKASIFHKKYHCDIVMRLLIHLAWDLEIETLN